jgi:hypothetical protein
VIQDGGTGLPMKQFATITVATRVLLKGVRLYLSKRLDVYWGIATQI